MSDRKTAGKSVSEKLLSLTINAPDESLRAAFRALATAGGDERHGSGEDTRTYSDTGAMRLRTPKSN